LVVLDVVVTNKKGELVKTLSKDDFQIYEDKTPQAIRSFEHQQPPSSTARISVASTAELDKQEPQAPVSIIVLDEINTRFEDEAFTRYALKKYLNTQGDTLLQPTMLVAVDIKHFMVLRDYTTSKKDILSALDRHRAVYPWQMMSGWKAERYKAAFASLLEVSKASVGHPGHKNMIWVGRGFPTLSDDTMVSLPADAREELRSVIALCTNELRDARVTLYTIDPAGVSAASLSADANGFPESDPFGGQIEFSAMASATGGMALFGRNDVDRLINRSIQAGEDFYTVSYAPAWKNAGESLYHSIRVTTSDPDLRATTRKGFYSVLPGLNLLKDAASKSSDSRGFDLSLASASTMVYDGIPMVIARDPNAPDTFHIHLRTKDIRWKNAEGQKVTTALTLVVESFDAKGNRINHSAKALELRVAGNADSTAPEQEGLNLVTTIPTAAPATRIRVVLRAEDDGKLGAENFSLLGQKVLPAQ
jgi:VWFA-related protein